MTTTTSNVSLCRYWVKPDKEAEFKKLLERHWPVFTALGLVADTPPHLVFRGQAKDGSVFYVETFPWKDAAAVERAHSLPEVAAVWEPMGTCCSKMEFENVEPVAL
jgi:hypothetical protein